MGIVKDLKEKTDRKTLEEAVAASRAELTRRRTALAAAEEARTLAEAAAARGSWSEKRAFRNAEDAVERGEDAVAEAVVELRGREAELENHLAEGEAASGAASSRWMKAARKRAAELSALLRGKVEEDLLPLAKEAVALVIEAEARAPRKLVARRSLRTVRCEVLDEGMKARHGQEMNLEFFAARRAQEKGQLRIIPSASLELRPEDIEYQRGSAPLPPELAAIKNINLGSPVLSEDARETLDFNRIEAMLSENEKKAAVAAVGEA